MNNHYDEVREATCYESFLECCGCFVGCLRLWAPCLCCCCNSPLYKLPTSTDGILQRFGRYQKRLQPGLNIINPCSNTVLLVDMKTKVALLQKHPVLTKDNVTVGIQTIVYYRVVDSFKVVYKLGTTSAEAYNFIAEMSHAALRVVAGEHTLQDLLDNRAKIALELQKYVENQVDPWGLFIENIFLKDLTLDAQTERNLSAAARQKRTSQATIISAQADVSTAKMLKEAAQILNSKAAMQIRYLEMIQEIANRPNPKLIFMNLKGKDYDK